MVVAGGTSERIERDKAPRQNGAASTVHQPATPIVRRSALRVGAVDDPAEAEADRIADVVVRALASPGPAIAASSPRAQRAHAVAGPSVRRSADDTVIRRKIAFTSAAFKSSTSIAADMKGLMGKKSTFARIATMLDDYHRTADPVEETWLLQQIYRLCDTWLTDHTGKEDDPQKRGELTELRKQAVTDIVAAQNRASSPVTTTGGEQRDYLDKINQTRTSNSGFQYLTSTGLDTADWMRGALDATQPMPDMTKAIGKQATDAKSQALREVMRKYNLTQAEATAIGVYTAQDYIYVNPTVAQNDAWLESQMKNPKLGPKNDLTQKVLAQARGGAPIAPEEKTIAKSEGVQHAQMARSGLQKLPRWSGTTYRGKGVTPDELARLAKPGANWKEDAFASSSQRPKKAEEFAASVTGGKIGVLMVLRMSAGRDVAPLSFADEAEVLALPGATFRVTDVTKTKIGKATVTVIHADQVT